MTVLLLCTQATQSVALRRLARAQIRVGTVVFDAASCRERMQTENYDAVIALAEPDLLPTDLLFEIDLSSSAVLALVANRRHRLWAQMIELEDTLWVFAPAEAYKTVVRERVRLAHKLDV